MWKRWSVVVVLLLTVTAAFGQSRSNVIKQSESSLLVTGNVEIAADGTLEKMTIDGRDRLPSSVVGLIEQTSKEWRFAPTIRDGKAMRAKGPMTLRVVANKLDDGRYRLRLTSATFGSDEGHPDEVVTAGRMDAPFYPMGAVMSGVQGTVFVIVRIGRDGKVLDAFAEQTNLRVVGTGMQMKAFRAALERPAISAAKKWTFVTPKSGEWAGEESWVARVPVDYFLSDAGKKAREIPYGTWETYIPGPRADFPWKQAQPERFYAGGDALVSGGVYQVGSGPHLLTPLGPPG